MKIASTLLMLVSFQLIQAQMVNGTAGYELERSAYEKGSQQLTSQKSTFYDSISPGSMLYLNRNGYELAVNPALDLQFGLQQESSQSLYRQGLGFDLRIKKSRWNFGAIFLHQNARYADYQSAFIAEKKVVPAMNVARGSNAFRSEYISAFVNYQTNSIFDLELGYGRMFIGDGYRSFLLADNGKSAPYLKANASFWKFKYSFILGIQQDIYQVEANQSAHRQKYTATHYLDWKVTKWLSWGLFETIVWQDQEENYRRGFDVNYLNPVIFFRPVEFSVGSSDNAIIGTNLKLTISKNHHLYFQLVFDEFLLNELRADARQWLNPNEDIQSGWWANKYAIQAGWKSYDFLNVKGLFTQFEFNMARPFIYSHSSPTQAYSNFNLPLAHPLGANFEEFVSRVNYNKDKWIFGFQWNHYRTGTSPIGTNMGENILISNSDRSKEYENFTTQGESLVIDYFELSVSYLLKKEWNTRLNLGVIVRNADGVEGELSNQFFTIGLKTNLYNQYFDY